MSSVSEKRNRFEILMEQAGVPTEIIDEFFKDGYIDKVEVSNAQRQWTFHIAKSQFVPQSVYRSFCTMIRDKYAHIAQICFVLHFGDDVQLKELVDEYWSLFIEWTQQDVASINGWLNKAQVSVEDRTITVTLIDQLGYDMAKRKLIDQRIRQFFAQFFNQDVQVKLEVSETSSEVYEQFAKEVREYEQEVAREMISLAREEQKSAPDEKVELIIGYPIHDEPVPLQNIQDVEKKVTIQGTVFGLEMKELRNGNHLYIFHVTDYTDSLTVKAFARNKDDMQAYSQLANGKWLRLRGKVEYDTFVQPPELVMMPSDLHEVLPPSERTDEAEEKRVEFHLHTTMSTMDAITPVDEYIKTAAKWGHKAIAITDHGGIQSFPDAYSAAQKHNIKVIYGLEANVVNDSVPIVANPRDEELEQATYVVFDIETTGLSVTNNKIIEIAGVKMQEGKVIEHYSTFIQPHEKIPYNITKLTNITDEMLVGAPELADELPNFVRFVGDAVLVAHNANFDMGFIQENCKRLGLSELTNPVLDTLEMARLLYPTMKNHRLNTLADKFKVSLENHHRAIDDSEALGAILFHMIKDAGLQNIRRLSRLNDHVGKDLTNTRPFHCLIYALNEIGKKNLYKLVSLSHTQYFHRVPCIPKSVLTKMREGLLIASGCEKGEFYEAVLNKSLEEAEEVAEFYDILEVQPIDVSAHLVERGFVGSREDLQRVNRRICEIGEKLNKPVIATGNVHYLHPIDKIHRDITIHGITGFSPLKDQRKPDVHFRTTNEMLAEFEHLGKQKAYEVVVINTNQLADRFEDIELFPKKTFTPNIEGADEEIRDKCYATARRMYGENLPEVVTARLEKELTPIIKYGFSANYLISERLVKKSNEDGYLVGSRGSVGSSFVATALGISEVNPLPPHYVCGSCQYSEWFTDGSVSSGYDLPEQNCPQCGQKMKGDGQDIPFETFLGFKGDKVPDIDLNFSGDYQATAHNYTKVLFSEKSVFRAGTIGTVAEKTAYGYVKKFEEDKGKSWRNAEVLRLASGCTGVKRNTGQHPGGIVVVPDYIEVEDITPVQYPADDMKSEWKTTHFDYHSFEANLLKLDILGHSDPSMMRMLYDLTKVDPLSIPMNDPKVLSLFYSTKELGVTPEQIKTSVGTYGLPDFGSKFTRQMLTETKPSTFSDLLQISGLSHGTGVWLGNAQELIRSGVCTISTVIGCRDNIMLYLIYQGMDAALAFQITESVRRGRGLTPEWIEEMKKVNVPNWYIDSCQKIEYMFPRAHAAAYCISAVRTGFYKLYYPIEFYAASFTIDGADQLDVETCCEGYEAILKKIIEIEDKGFQALPKEKAMIPTLELALEMTARGLHFKPIDLYRSHATQFIIEGDSLIPPFFAIPGVGENAARNIAAAREGGEFLSIEDFQQRSRASKTVVELLAEMGCFRGLPESNQLSLF